MDPALLWWTQRVASPSILIDTATLHSVWRVLHGTATVQDCRNFLQLLVAIVFCEAIWVNGHEPANVNSKSRIAIEELKRLGCPGDLIRFSGESRDQYAQCCYDAGDDMAAGLGATFSFGRKRVAQADRPELSRQQWARESRIGAVLRHDTAKGGLHGTVARPEDATDAPLYMLAQSGSLWKAMGAFVRDHGWSAVWTEQFVLVSRMHLNNRLAQFHGMSYQPAASRSSSVQRTAPWPCRALSSIMSGDEEPAGLRGVAVPPVGRVLLEASAGDVSRLAEETLKGRAGAIPLRRWLGSQPLVSSRKQLQDLQLLHRVLEQLSGNVEAPRLGNAIVMGPHGPEIHVRELREWWEFVRHRQKIEVLAKVRARAAEPESGRHIRTLLRNLRRSGREFGRAVR
jgi:hypothetical protein